MGERFWGERHLGWVHDVTVASQQLGERPVAAPRGVGVTVRFVDQHDRAGTDIERRGHDRRLELEVDVLARACRAGAPVAEGDRHEGSDDRSEQHRSSHSKPDIHPLLGPHESGRHDRNRATRASAASGEQCPDRCRGAPSDCLHCYCGGYHAQGNPRLRGACRCPATPARALSGAGRYPTLVGILVSA